MGTPEIHTIPGQGIQHPETHHDDTLHPYSINAGIRHPYTGQKANLHPDNVMGGILCPYTTP